MDKKEVISINLFAIEEAIIKKANTSNAEEMVAVIRDDEYSIGPTADDSNVNQGVNEIKSSDDAL
ncbi:MAG: hypothetical protein LBB05_01510 [Puniceicoccales bacterium]|jgi:hypothetical protein|nr:hypothetical protein [Puniceicoccales bacterium]